MSTNGMVQSRYGPVIIAAIIAGVVSAGASAILTTKLNEAAIAALREEDIREATERAKADALESAARREGDREEAAARQKFYDELRQDIQHLLYRQLDGASGRYRQP